MKNKLFLIEFYTNEPDGAGGSKAGGFGWEINLAWVFAADRDAAVDKMADSQGERFCEVIQVGERSDIRPLSGSSRVNTPDANLFILH